MIENECVICLDNINNNDLYIVKHNLCRYTIHKQCIYNKCVYCNKILIKNDYLINLLSVIVNKFLFIRLEYITDDNIILFMLFIINVYLLSIFLICPIIIIYHIINKYIIR